MAANFVRILESPTPDMDIVGTTQHASQAIYSPESRRFFAENGHTVETFVEGRPDDGLDYWNRLVIEQNAASFAWIADPDENPGTLPTGEDTRWRVAVRPPLRDETIEAFGRFMKEHRDLISRPKDSLALSDDRGSQSQIVAVI